MATYVKVVTIFIPGTACHDVFGVRKDSAQLVSNVDKRARH